MNASANPQSVNFTLEVENMGSQISERIIESLIDTFGDTVIENWVITTRSNSKIESLNCYFNCIAASYSLFYEIFKIGNQHSVFEVVPCWEGRVINHVSPNP